MNSFTRNLLMWSTIGIAIGLSACSSGGDGNSGFVAPQIPAEPVAITPTNENQVAQVAYGASSGGVGLAGGAFDMIPGAVVVDGSASSNDVNLYGTLRKLLDNALDNRSQQNNNLSVSAVQFSDTESCAYQDPFTLEVIGSGSESFSINVADFNAETGEPNSLTNGDYFNVTFNACDYGDGIVQKGSMSMTINSNVSMADINAEVFTLDVTISLNNYSTTGSFGTETLHGTIDLNLDVNGTSVAFDMSGNSLYAVSSNESVHLTNFSFVATINNSTNSAVTDSMFTVASTTLNGKITVDSHLETIGFGYPTVGYINITGDSSNLNITVNGDGTINVTLIIGGTVQSGYPKDVPWSDLGIEVNGAFG